MANKVDQEWLINKLVEQGLHLIKKEELDEAYKIARHRWNNPKYCQFVTIERLLKDVG